MPKRTEVVENLFAVELCQDCPLREGHNNEPRFISNTGPSLSESGTELLISSQNNDGNIQITSLVVEAVRRTPVLRQAFDQCRTPIIEHHLIRPDSVMCGAVAALRKKVI